MTGETAEALILRDDHGEWYVVPQALLSECRVTAQELAALRRGIVEDEAAQGYMLALTPPVFSTVGVAAVVAPRDAATGQATGRRQWTPIRIIKEWPASG